MNVGSLVLVRDGMVRREVDESEVSIEREAARLETVDENAVLGPMRAALRDDADIRDERAHRPCERFEVDVELFVAHRAHVGFELEEPPPLRAQASRVLALPGRQNVLDARLARVHAVIEHSGDRDGFARRTRAARSPRGGHVACQVLSPQDTVDPGSARAWAPPQGRSPPCTLPLVIEAKVVLVRLKMLAGESVASPLVEECPVRFDEGRMVDDVVRVELRRQ